MKKIFYAIAITSVVFTSCEEAETETASTDESPSQTEAKTSPEESVTTEESPLPEGWEKTTTSQIVYLAIKDSVTNEEMQNLSPILAEKYGQIVAYMTEQNIEFAGMPLTHWFTWDTTALSIYAAGIPVVAGTLAGEGMELITIPASEALKYTHIGSYHDMELAHFAINEYIYGNGINVTGGPWEIYVTDPGTEPDESKWVTEIWYPLGN